MAAGDVDGDGLADIVTGAGPGGGPHVRVFRGTDRAELAGFIVPGDVNGVRVALADADADGRLDILTASGPLTPPLVRAFDIGTQSESIEFLAYDASFLGGVNVG